MLICLPTGDELYLDVFSISLGEITQSGIVESYGRLIQPELLK